MLPSTIATPIAAEWIGGTPPILQIHFTEDLLPNPDLNFANWIVKYDSIEYNVIDALSSGPIVVLELEGDQPSDPGDVVSYAPPPADVITLGSGIPVALFTDFPIGTA